jgi:hypothetical protein
LHQDWNVVQIGSPLICVWKYASGVDLDYPVFVHSMLADMRERLRNSERPNRIFEAVLEMAKGAGQVGRRRVLDSTALCSSYELPSNP